MGRLIVERQDALCLFFREEDEGNWFAVCCAGGFMRMLGRKVEKGERITVEIELKEVRE
jgi:hypothetical protein